MVNLGLSLLARSLQPMFWFQPLFYSVHGWLATEMALWMMFHPYEPKYLPGTRIQLPLTPGIFPRGRQKLSQAIANTITDILLTQADIHRQAQKLLTKDNIATALGVILDTLGPVVQDMSHLRRVYRTTDTLLPVALEKIAAIMFENLETSSDRDLKVMLDPFLNAVIPHLRLNNNQAVVLSRLLCQHLLTPERLRQVLIAALTPETIAVLSDAIKSRTSGLQGVLLLFIDLGKGFSQFRTFLIDQPEEACEFLETLMQQLALEQRGAEALTSFSLTQLPYETLETLKLQVIHLARESLSTHREALGALVVTVGHRGARHLSSGLLRLDVGRWTSQLPELKNTLAKWIHTYLHRELENLLSLALPVISLNTVIVEKIDQFSSQELEATIHRICHRELRWLAFLGAFLGFWLGLLSNLITFEV